MIAKRFVRSNPPCNPTPVEFIDYLFSGELKEVEIDVMDAWYYDFPVYTWPKEYHAYSKY